MNLFLQKLMNVYLNLVKTEVPVKTNSMGTIVLVW